MSRFQQTNQKKQKENITTTRKTTTTKRTKTYSKCVLWFLERRRRQRRRSPTETKHISTGERWTEMASSTKSSVWCYTRMCTHNCCCCCCCCCLPFSLTALHFSALLFYSSLFPFGWFAWVFTHIYSWNTIRSMDFLAVSNDKNVM